MRNLLKRKYLACFAVSLMLFLPCTILRHPCFGFVKASIVETILYLIVTYALLRKYSNNKKDIFIITLVVLLGRTSLEIPVRMQDFTSSLISLPNTLLACFSIFLSSLIYITKGNKIIIIITFFVWGYSVFYLHRRCIDYIVYGSTPKQNLSAFVLNTGNGVVRLDSLSGDYILLDFWCSSCGICYEKFPEVQSLYNENKDKVTIASVFVPCRKNEQETDGKVILDKCGYTFPVWSVSCTSDTLLRTLKIDRFPRVVVLDKNRNVVVSGSLNNAKDKLDDILNK